MSDELEDDELTPDDELRPGLRGGAGALGNSIEAPPAGSIARPPAPSTIPPVTLRGLGAPAAAPEAGSTEDLETRGLSSRIAGPGLPPQPPTLGSTEQLENRGLENHLAPPSANIAKPNQPRTIRSLWHDTGNIQSTPLKVLSRIGVGALGVVDAAGHNALEKRAQAQKEQDIQDQGTQARTEQAQAAAEKDRAEAAGAGQPKPKEEKWTLSTAFTDADGTPLNHEENSGKLVRATDGKPPTGIVAAKPAVQAKPDTPEQQFIDEFQKQNPNGTIAQAITAYANANQKPERPEKPQRQLIIGPDGKVIELHPGDTVPQGSKTVTGELTNKPTADEQRRADLAENMNENLTQLEDILTRRPELFGPLAGRLTGLKETVGTSDPDVAALKTIQEQMGMAMVGAHAMRNAQHVETAARAITNSFHNSPGAIKSAIDTARKSISTFQGDVNRDQNRGAQTGTQGGGKAAPKAGEIEDGYRFKGGDPADKNNWEKQ